MSNYNTYPAVDDGYNFPPPVRQSLASSSEIHAVIGAQVSSEVPDEVTRALASDPTIVQAAVDALLSAAVIEQLSFNKGDLPPSANLNTILDAGIYGVWEVSTINNEPLDAIGSVLVEAIGTRTVQTYKTTHNTPQVWIRVGYNNGTVWHPWEQIDAVPLKKDIETLEKTKVDQSRVEDNRLEFEDDYGRNILIIDNLSDDPHIRGSDTPSTVPTDTDFFEVTDVDGRRIFVIDDLKTNPNFRSSEDRETHFILIAGQSNAVGVAGPSPIGTNNELPNLYTIPQNTSGGLPETRSKDPLSHPYNTPVIGTIGFGATVARQYALENPNVRVVVIPLARTGSGFFYSTSAYTWAPSRVGEAGVVNLYSQAISRANEAISRYSGNRRVAMILWHQGEADSMGGTTGTQYSNELDLLISGFRNNILYCSDSIFILGQMGYEFREILKPGTVDQINSAHVDTPNRVEKTSFAKSPLAGFMEADKTHFTGLGQKLLAESYLDARLTAHFNS